MPRQIVVVMTDTQRYDMLGCAGPAGIRTEHLDRLAGEAVRFERAYTCQGVCQPARAAMFTGTWPHENGGWTNSQALGDNVKTLGQRFRDHGFHCAHVGKWHLDGGDYFGLGRCPDGWDDRYWYDMRRYLEELSPRERLDSRRTEYIRERPVTPEFTYAHRCSRRAREFLARHAREDFLLVVSYDEPHGPCLCPPEFLDRYENFHWPASPAHDDTLADKPEHQRIWAGEALDDTGWRERNHGTAAYFACNEFVDAEIGSVLEAVDRHAPGALVVYTSDHGDALGEHRLIGKGPCVYDGVVRIPLIVRWPGVTQIGRVAASPVSHIDLAPTLFDFAGLPQPAAFSGRSLRPACADPAVRVNETVFIEFGRFEVDHDGFGGFQPMRAAFDGRWKLAVNLLSGDELYDLDTDPHECVNRIADPLAADDRGRLHDRMLDWMNATRDPFRGHCWERRPWRTDARPATWPYTGMTRQRENEEYEPRQLDYNTGLPMTQATRQK